QATADAGTANETPAYVYAYSPVGKRDPFRSPIVDHPVNEQGPQCENAGPLGSWGLDQLTLVATVTSDANPIGMVEDPGGKGYIIRRNTPVGSMCGKVTEVLRDCVTITEYYPTPDGKRVPNPKKLCLKSDLDQKGDVDLNTGKPIQ
ncbi:MAG: pilus assembly protein PilP, partial [Myxococcaceae bacterium]